MRGRVAQQSNKIKTTSLETPKRGHCWIAKHGYTQEGMREGERERESKETKQSDREWTESEQNGEEMMTMIKPGEREWGET
jgi:hypothetical protein